jgi:antitoxin (DNA-binding transcriptional repressor) of toxin-antitoxin stability system
MPSAEMPSITLSQLRNSRQLRAWLRAGKTVELRERNRVIAHIIPVKVEARSRENPATDEPASSV